MSNNSVNRVTLYKLKLKKQSDFAPNNYKEVTNGSSKIGNRLFKYWLHFMDQHSSKPSWLNFFSGLNLNLSGGKAPKTVHAGFILLIQTGNSFYAVTGGLGFLHLQSAADIEPRFGIGLAEKILSLPELKGLVQKDTSGVVNNIDRVFRGTYNPNGELDNLKRVLTKVRGKLEKTNASYATIGKSIQAGNSITVNGPKEFDDLFPFLASIEELQKAPNTLTIPQLDHIEKRFNPALLLSLQQTLIQHLLDYKADGKANLFLDNEEIGYLPDRIESYELRYAHKKYADIDSYEGVLEKVSEILKSLPDTQHRIDAYKKLRLHVIFDDEKSDTRDLHFFICGDVTYKNEVYFINNRLWYQAGKEFLKKLDSELNNIAFIPADKLSLVEWDAIKHVGQMAEHEYNKECQQAGNFILMDRRDVKIPQEKGGIEFCDLLGQASPTQLIHVKKANGAALRALFAQGYVSAKFYADSTDFRNQVHTSQLKDGKKLNATEKAALAALSGKYKREFQIIFAIYDDTKSHKAPAKSKLTSEALEGTLTPFAKVDLLERVTSIRSMGYEVAVTRIKPFPK